jgi:hypothetical protein
VVLAVGLNERHWLARVLGCGFLRFFGRYSYGLYVIHGLIAPALVTALPVAAFIDALGSAGWGGLACALARIVPCVALSLVSWHLLEVPFLRLKRHFEYPSGGIKRSVDGLAEAPVPAVPDNGGPAESCPSDGTGSPSAERSHDLRTSSCNPSAATRHNGGPPEQLIGCDLRPPDESAARAGHSGTNAQ